MPKPGPDASKKSGTDPTPSASMDATKGRRSSEKSPVFPSVDLTDQRLGEFRLLRRLGAGGMAEVYLAEQTSLKRRVAVKVLYKDLVAESSYLQRFAREAKAAAALNHPNIVQVYSIGEHDGWHFIAQEYVQGLNLKEYIARKGPPSLSASLHIMRQVASALQAAGDAGIVHRDIKPENIMLTRKGDVKVTDFGLAQLTQSGERVDLTQVGVTMGTPLYMSPEQVSGESLDQRSDIYSFGITCYHMLTGEPPFQGETALAVAVQHLKDDAKPLDECRPDLPAPICSLVHAMMAKSRDERIEDANGLLEAVKQTAKVVREGGDADALGFRRSSRRLPRVWRSIAFSTVFVVSASAAVGWAMRTSDPRTTPPVAATTQKMGSAAEQYSAASFINDEEAWLAVVKHYPKDRRYVQSARHHLGILYLRARRFDDAEEMFDQLVLSGKGEEAFRDVGYAGKAVLASLRGEHSRSQRIIKQNLMPLDDRLGGAAEMRRLIERTQGENLKQLGQAEEEDLDSLWNETDESTEEK